MDTGLTELEGVGYAPCLMYAEAMAAALAVNDLVRARYVPLGLHRALILMNIIGPSLIG